MSGTHQNLKILGIEKISEIGYRWVPGTEKISEVGYRWVLGTSQKHFLGTDEY